MTREKESHFPFAVKQVLRHEGGYVNDPDDPGGETNWGISSRFLHKANYKDEVRTMTRERAVEIYRREFWREEYETLPQWVAIKVFDIAVNAGPQTAMRLLQRALRAVGATNLKDDGFYGPHTASRIALVAGIKTTREVLASLRSEQAGFYRELVVRQPVLRKYLEGWLRRAYA